MKGCFMKEKIVYVCSNDSGNLLIGRLIESGYTVDIVKSKSDISILQKKDSISAVILHISSNQAEEINVLDQMRKSLGLRNIKLIVITVSTLRNIIKRAIDEGAVEIITDISKPDLVIRKISEKVGFSLKSNKKDLYIEKDFILLSFRELINRELKAASRGNYQLSVVSLYPVNEMGLFTELSEDFYNSLKAVCINTLRDTDYAFIQDHHIVAILPFADIDGCEIVVQRLKDVYKTHPALKPVNQYTELFASYATFPEDGKVLEKILDKAESGIRKLLV